jgi:cytoskeletal protein CcmA (bactofilin family)
VPQVRVLPGAFLLGENIMAFGTEKKPDFRDYDSSSQSFFGKTMRIEGEITSEEDLTIEGKVKGQLEISNTLTIGKEGYVDGKISAKVVQISGEGEGHLTALEKLVIFSEGKYTGNITADTIKVAEGARIKGTINIVEEKAKPAETIEPLQGKKEPPEKKELKKQGANKPEATK